MLRLSRRLIVMSTLLLYCEMECLRRGIIILTNVRRPLHEYIGNVIQFYAMER